MKNKGSAFNLIFSAIIILLAIYFGFGSLGTMSKAQMQNCAVNASGGIENCSLSNNAYWAMNATDTASLQIFNVMSWLPMLLTVAAFITGIYLIWPR